MTTTRNTSDFGLNRTGIGMSPLHGKAMIEDAREAAPTSPGDDHAIDEVRMEYTAIAEPIGTVPPPSTIKGAAKAAVELLKGKRPAVLLDRLGERLAFERTGVRAYQALLAKFDRLESWDGGPSREELSAFASDELAHFQMLREAMESLGADPTAVSPAADIAGVLTTGVLQVLDDPRTTLPQGLHAMLTAELMDRDGWELLIQLATRFGQEGLATRFSAALRDEQRHLSAMRDWVLGDAEREAEKG